MGNALSTQLSHKSVIDTVDDMPVDTTVFVPHTCERKAGEAICKTYRALVTLPQRRDFNLVMSHVDSDEWEQPRIVVTKVEKHVRSMR